MGPRGRGARGSSLGGPRSSPRPRSAGLDSVDRGSDPDRHGSLLDQSLAPWSAPNRSRTPEPDRCSPAIALIRMAPGRPGSGPPPTRTAAALSALQAIEAEAARQVARRERELARLSRLARHHRVDLPADVTARLQPQRKP